MVIFTCQLSESWEDEEVDANVWVATQPNSSTRLKCFTEEGLKQFIAKTLKEHDEKLVAEMEKEKENGYPLPDDYYDKTKIIGEQRAEAWNNAIDRAIEIVRGGEK